MAILVIFVNFYVLVSPTLQWESKPQSPIQWLVEIELVCVLLASSIWGHLEVHYQDSHAWEWVRNRRFNVLLKHLTSPGELWTWCISDAHFPLQRANLFSTLSSLWYITWIISSVNISCWAKVTCLSGRKWDEGMSGSKMSNRTVLVIEDIGVLRISPPHDASHTSPVTSSPQKSGSCPGRNKPTWIYSRNEPPSRQGSWDMPIPQQSSLGARGSWCVSGKHKKAKKHNAQEADVLQRHQEESVLEEHYVESAENQAWAEEDLLQVWSYFV